ncbi:MAG: hypothetical protein ACFCUR_16495 [Rhodomicrobiaceae bacterium]
MHEVAWPDRLFATTYMVEARAVQGLAAIPTANSVFTPNPTG